jgi:hypothetical protein
MKTIEIISVHNSLSAAVKASGMDLSYNPSAAAEEIANLEAGNKTFIPVRDSYVTNDGVYFFLQEIGGCRFFHKFEPFHSCLSDGTFKFVSIGTRDINFSDSLCRKDDNSFRKMAAECNWLLA